MANLESEHAVLLLRTGSVKALNGAVVLAQKNFAFKHLARLSKALTQLRARNVRTTHPITIKAPSPISLNASADLNNCTATVCVGSVPTQKVCLKLSIFASKRVEVGVWAGLRARSVKRLVLASQTSRCACPHNFNA